MGIYLFIHSSTAKKKRNEFGMNCMIVRNLIIISFLVIIEGESINQSNFANTIVRTWSNKKFPQSPSSLSLLERTVIYTHVLYFVVLCSTVSWLYSLFLYHYSSSYGINTKLEFKIYNIC